MKIRSIDALEKELKVYLASPHTSNNMKNAVSMAEKILEVKKIATMRYTLWPFMRFVWLIELHQWQIIQKQ